MPRRRVNQSEMSAISGPKVAEVPKPISSRRRARTATGWSREAGGDEAEAERDRAERDRRQMPKRSDSRPISDAAEREAHHGQRERQRGVAARHAELGLHGRQRHRHRPHADAADGAERRRGGEAQPGISGVDAAAAAGERGSHGADPGVQRQLLASRACVRPIH